MADQHAAPYVFISYASGDRAQVLPLVDAMTRVGIGVWIDREGIHGGANYGEEIAGAIRDSAALVLMTSARSLASRNVKQEIALAWDFERPYVPLLLEPVTIPTDVRYWLTTAQWVEVFDKSASEWLPQVLTALAPLGIAPAPPQLDEIRLAGRERELALLREKLSAAKGSKGGLVLIGGEAGIGKTTLAESASHEAERQGFVVLEGHCFDLADTPPYGPWIDLFAHYVPSPSSPPLPPAFTQRGTVGAVSSQMALFVAVEDFLTALTTQRPAGIPCTPCCPNWHGTRARSGSTSHGSTMPPSACSWRSVMVWPMTMRHASSPISKAAPRGTHCSSVNCSAHLKRAAS